MDNRKINIQDCEKLNLGDRCSLIGQTHTYSNQQYMQDIKDYTMMMGLFAVLVVLYFRLKEEFKLKGGDKT